MGIFSKQMPLQIDISITCSFTVDVQVEEVYETEYDVEYGIVEEVEEIEIVEEEPEVDIGYAIETDGYEGWGGDVNVPARGWYEYGGNRDSMNIWNLKLNTENEIRGVGDDPNGVFDIIGTMDGNFFRFDKIYRGAHTVIYRGTRRGGILSGNWEIPGNCEGRFRIQTGWQKWKGGFWQGDFYAMDLDNMYVGETGVTGCGYDEKVGYFKISGWKNGDTVCFAKEYIGAHTVFYQGTLNGRYLAGRWEIPGNCEGKFGLTCNRDP